MDLLAASLPPGTVGLPGPESWIVQPVGGAARVPLNTGASVGGGTPDAGRLRPGSACAIPLITGDARLGAIGTVTWVDGDDVLMMGHPFMQRGPVAWPLATAEILTVFPSRQMSFKMGSIGDVVGTVHHDRRAGLAGRVGAAPGMVPVAVAVRSGDQELTYGFEVVDDSRLTATMVFWALYNSLLAQGDDASEQSLGYRIETLWEGGGDLGEEPLVLEGVTAGPGGAMRLASEWMAPLNILLNNPFSEVRLREVRARLEVSRPMAAATISGVTGARVLSAGSDQAVYQVEVTPRQGKPETLEISLALPASLEPGPYRLLVASAAELFAFESQRATGRFQVSSLEAIVDILRTERSASTLVVALLAPGGNLVLPGRELHDLPGSVSRLISAGNMQASRTLADYVARSHRPVPWALGGFAVRAVTVEAAVEPFKEERRPGS